MCRVRSRRAVVQTGLARETGNYSEIEREKFFSGRPPRVYGSRVFQRPRARRRGTSLSFSFFSFLWLLLSSPQGPPVRVKVFREFLCKRTNSYRIHRIPTKSYFSTHAPQFGSFSKYVNTYDCLPVG